jgi:hypothetical protein
MADTKEFSIASRPFLAYRARIELYDFLAYMGIVERLQISRTTRRAVWGLSLMLLFLSVTALSLGLSWEAYLLMAFGGYCITWPIHHPLYLRWHYRRVQHLLPDSDVTVDDGGVRAESALADVKYAWESIKLAVDSPEGVLFCNELRQALTWIPQRAFASGGSKADLLAVAARHGTKVLRFGGD